MLGKEYTMVDLKHLLAYSISLECMRDELLPDSANTLNLEGIRVEVKDKDSRLDNQFHFWGADTNRRQCLVHLARHDCPGRKCPMAQLS